MVVRAGACAQFRVPGDGCQKSSVDSAVPRGFVSSLQGCARYCVPTALYGANKNPRASSTAVVSNWLRLVHKVRLGVDKNLHRMEGN
jgi:hypothetical protein